MNVALRIHFLGTSAARPIPRWGCTCPQCAAAVTDPHARRTRSAILVNGTLLVDPGPDIYAQLYTLPYDQLAGIDHILITHPHADHFLGLDDLAALRRISELPVLPIYAHADGWERIQTGFHYLIAAEVSQYDRRPFVRREFALEHPLELPNGLTVTPLDTHHTQAFTTAGLLIERQGRRALYAPDFFGLPEERVAGADLLILDGSFLGQQQMNQTYRPLLEEGQGRHMPVFEAIKWAQSTGAQRVLFTHVGHVGLAPDHLRELLPPGYDVAHDGLVVEL